MRAATRSCSAAPTTRCSPASSPTPSTTRSVWSPAPRRPPRTSTGSWPARVSFATRSCHLPCTGSSPPATRRASPAWGGASSARRSAPSTAPRRCSPSPRAPSPWGVADVQLTILGCSGTFPGPTSPCSSYLFEAEGYRLLVDVGNGATGSLQACCDLLDIDAIVVSHLHGDHYLDLINYTYVRRYHPRGTPPPLPV